MEPIEELTDRQLIDELIRRNEDRFEKPVHWTKHFYLRQMLFDAGKIIAEWDGREESIKNYEGGTKP